jgi:large subunit ribosomal protein L36e
MELYPERIQPATGEVVKSGIIRGRSRGYQTKKIISRNQHRKNSKGFVSEQVSMRIKREEVAKDLAREICGRAPYEKRALDFAKRGEEKKMKKFLKKRLGTLRAAKRKQEELFTEARGL